MWSIGRMVRISKTALWLQTPSRAAKLGNWEAAVVLLHINLNTAVSEHQERPPDEVFEEWWPYGLSIRCPFTSRLSPALAIDFLRHLGTTYILFSIGKTEIEIMSCTADCEGRISKCTGTSQNEEHAQWRKTVEEITVINASQQCFSEMEWISASSSDKPACQIQNQENQNENFPTAVGVE